MSTIIKTAVISITIILTITIFQRDNTSTNVNSTIKDITNDQNKHYFTENGGTYFAIKLQGPTPEKLLDSSYFTFQLLQNSYIKQNNSQGFSFSSTPIEYEYCRDKFPHVDKATYDKAGLAEYICPKNSNFFVRANFNSDNFEVIQVNVLKWSSSSCKSDDEINKVLNTHTLQLAILSSYIDFDDYKTPLHYYLQDLNFLGLIPTLSLKTQYKIRLNTAEFSDSLNNS